MKIIAFIITITAICVRNTDCASIDNKAFPEYIKAGDYLTINCTTTVTSLEAINYVIILKENVPFIRWTANQSSPIISLINGIPSVDTPKSVGQVTIRNANSATAGTYTCLLNYRIKSNNQTSNTTTISTVHFINTLSWVGLLLTPSKFKKNESTIVNCTYGYPTGNSFESITLSKDGKNFTIFTNTLTLQIPDQKIKINTVPKTVGQENITADSSGTYRCLFGYRDNYGVSKSLITSFSNGSNDVRPVLSLLISSLFLILARVV